MAVLPVTSLQMTDAVTNIVDGSGMYVKSKEEKPRETFRGEYFCREREN